MAKGVSVTEVLLGVAREQGAETARVMAKRLKQEVGVDVTFTVSPKVRKRKHRWGTVQGKVVGARFTDAEYAVLARKALDKGLSVGGYLKWLANREPSEEKGLTPSEPK
jgi:hypothetical protein